MTGQQLGGAALPFSDVFPESLDNEQLAPELDRRIRQKGVASMKGLFDDGRLT